MSSIEFFSPSMLSVNVHNLGICIYNVCKILSMILQIQTNGYKLNVKNLHVDKSCTGKNAWLLWQPVYSKQVHHNLFITLLLGSIA